MRRVEVIYYDTQEEKKIGPDNGGKDRWDEY